MGLTNPTEVIQNISHLGGSYHKLSFPDGTVLQGIFDMSRYLKYYQIPNLKGKTVLDVGTGTGYFAFEFAKMGAEVTAISDVIKEVHFAANKLMGTDVKFLKKDLYTIDEKFGKFDIVFCSHVLQHIPDMFSAISKIYSVTKEQAIFGINIIGDKKWDDVPAAIFGGFKSEKNGGKFPTYWIPSRSCCVKMMQVAGFRNIKKISFFDLYGEEKKVNKIPTDVYHCFI
ncbi:MAG TPA: class I SAM-dependent methyltransferase [Nitrosopumilaceae archaeon]|nr:class I SAM-dependent methyltransferase [Nitrosopumilaceae archaeon]